MGIIWTDLLTILVQYMLAAYFVARFIDAGNLRWATMAIGLGGFLCYGLCSYVVPQLYRVKFILINVVQVVAMLRARRVPLLRCLVYYTVTLCTMTLLEIPFDLILTHFYPSFQSIRDVSPVFLLMWRSAYLPLFALGFLLPYKLLGRYYGMEQDDSSNRFLPFLLLQGILLLLPMTIALSAIERLESMTWGAVGYVAVNILLDVLLVQTFNRLGKAHAMEQRQRENEAMVQMQLDYYNQLQDNMSVLRQVRHDMKNQLTTLSILLEQKDYDTALRQITAVEETLEQRGLHTTGNPMIDAVLAAKAAACREDGIPMEVRGTMPADLGENEVRLCSLISRMMELAAEGCRKAPPECQPRLLFSVEKNSPLTLLFCFHRNEGDEPQLRQQCQNILAESDLDAELSLRAVDDQLQVRVELKCGA